LGNLEATRSLPLGIATPAPLLLYLSQKIAVTKLQRRQRADGERLYVTFLVEMKASEVEEENVPALPPRFLEGVSAFPFYFDFCGA
jgi:hypothetical protein